MKRATFLLALPLAACSPGGNSSISITDAEGNVSITSDASGAITIKAPGVDISAKLPKIDIDASDFDVNGVKLYPGSKIRDFDLAATEGAGKKDDARLSIAFEAPAALDKVQAWFRENMAQRGFKVQAKGAGFSGTTKDGDPFTLELQADGAERSKGRMSVDA